jgi:hypothetical protein
MALIVKVKGDVPVSVQWQLCDSARLRAQRTHPRGAFPQWPAQAMLKA